MSSYEKNARLPLGFSANSPAAKYLTFKHFLLEHHLVSEEILFSDNFIDYATEIFRAMKNFNQFFNEIILE